MLAVLFLWEYTKAIPSEETDVKRYELDISEDHREVSLRDLETGEIHAFEGARALYDALGVLADWRERDTHSRDYGATDRVELPLRPDEVPCLCQGADLPHPAKLCDAVAKQTAGDLAQHKSDYVRETMAPDGSRSSGPIPEIAPGSGR